MAENLLASTVSPEPKTQDSRAERPSHIPEKFWDPTTKNLRADALLKSYLELEKRLSMTSSNPDKQQTQNAPHVPSSHEDYPIKCDHGLFSPDMAINKKMHDLHFTPEQAQLVYDLAAEHMVPLIREVAAQFQAEQEIERLKSHFGGEDSWRTMAPQILSWAKRNLPPTAVEALSTTHDGVLAMHRMMSGHAEPSSLGRAAGNKGGENLTKMVQDPRYWRDRNPEFIARVTEGFQNLYNQGE